MNDHEMLLRGINAVTPDPLEVIYRARRLLQTNPEDATAKSAIRKLRNLPAISSDPFLELFTGSSASSDFVQHSELVERRRGESLLLHGDTGKTMFLVLSGELAAYLPNHRSSVEKKRPGQLVGELAFMLGQPRTATVKCLRASSLLAFNYDTLRRRLADQWASPISNSVLNSALQRGIFRYVYNKNRAVFESSFSDGVVEYLDAELEWGYGVVEFPESETISPGEPKLKHPGVSILVSGRVHDQTTGNVLSGDGQPVLFADFPNGTNQPPRTFVSLSRGVKVVSISIEALQHLPTVNSQSRSYSDIVARLSAKIVHAQKPTVFISYSHEDTEVKDQVYKCLAPLQRQGLLELWDDDCLKPGEQWRKSIEGAVRSCDVAILIVSKSFLNSDFVTQIEVPTLLRRLDDGTIGCVIPVVVEECRWRVFGLEKLQSLPAKGRNLRSLSIEDQERALRTLASQVESWILR